MKLYSDEELAEILDKPVFHLIGESADHLGLECYVVGGFVRDIFLERPSNDIDVVVVGSGIELAKEVKRRLGRKAHLSVFKNFGTAQVKLSEKCRVESVEFATAPQDSSRNSEELRMKSEKTAAVANSTLYTLHSTLPSGAVAARPLDACTARNSTLYTLHSTLEKDSTLELEFVGARRESYSHDSRKPIVEDGTLEDDQNRRDFTINAMAICLNKNRFGELVDPFNGLADLEDGIIATPLEPGITFSDDPLRMMRCIRFATQLNFQIEDETFEALQRMADRIKIVSGERIEVELNKIIMAPHPSIGFEYLQRSGLLQIILPELSALDIVEQKNGRAHKNNFYHTLEVLENVVSSEELRMKSEEFATAPEGSVECRVQSGEFLAVQASKGRAATAPQDSSRNSEQLKMNSGKTAAVAARPMVACYQRDARNSPLSTLHSTPEKDSTLYLRWAALLHDIGKTKTKRWDPAIGWTFHNHNYVGAKMVAQIFRRLKLPLGAEMRYVQKLVDMHMRPQVIADNEVTDSAVRRLLNDAGDDIDDLMCLCEADITSKNEVKKKMFLENFRMVREKLTDLKEKDYKRLLQPVIDGNEIMELFHLKPSREVGTLKQTLKDAVLDNKVENEREPLMQLLMQKAREMGLVQ